jgi:hypothetical protein
MKPTELIADLRSRVTKRELVDLWERLQPFKAHLLALGAAITLGVIVGIVKASTAPSRPVTVDRWNMPQWAPYQAASTLKEISAGTVFTPDANKKKNVAADVPVAPAWRFTGTFRKGGQQIALIETGKDKHILRVTSGDELPGGAKVTAVRIGELAYTNSAGEQILKLFESDKSSPASGGDPKK